MISLFVKNCAPAASPMWVYFKLIVYIYILYIYYYLDLPKLLIISSSL